MQEQIAINYNFARAHKNPRKRLLTPKEGAATNSPMYDKIRIERVPYWTPANAKTFNIPPIRALLDEEVSIPTDRDVETKDCFEWVWCDPFAGRMVDFLPTVFSNDLNPSTDVPHHFDALNYLKQFQDNLFAGCLFDPPYSITQANEHYKDYGADLMPEHAGNKWMWYWARCKDEIARIVRASGKVICFGWNSMGMGGRRGFEMKRILLVPHGGSRNDTIVTVETKTNQRRLPLTRSRARIQRRPPRKKL
jgi:hypothetical protein